MIKVGITGNIGSGKSIVTKIFSGLGVDIYDGDSNAKKFYNNSAIIDELHQYFGPSILNPDKSINKIALASIVFANPEALNKLNQIIHPKVIEDFQNWSAKITDKPYVILESAILFETGYNKLLDKIITVSCPENIRLNRVKQRDGLSDKDVLFRMKNQWNEQRKIELSDFVIVNDDKTLITPQILKLHQLLKLTL